MSKVSPGKKQIRSLRGKNVDMDLLRKRNELTPAVGNARVNARGDELGPNGTILRKREEIVAEHYATAGTAVHSEAPEVEVQSEVQPEPVAKKATKKVKVKAEPVPEVADLSAEEQEMMDEAAAEDEWVEDADGNFVQKGS
jgi:hypothetical protein|tara:strand:- start:49 stop:471 length:423 start_codon:yes stop_codon:yes gene_type:complete